MLDMASTSPTTTDCAKFCFPLSLTMAHTAKAKCGDRSYYARPVVKKQRTLGKLAIALEKTSGRFSHTSEPYSNPGSCTPKPSMSRQTRMLNAGCIFNLFMLLLLFMLLVSLKANWSGLTKC